MVWGKENPLKKGDQEAKQVLNNKAPHPFVGGGQRLAIFCQGIWRVVKGGRSKRGKGVPWKTTQKQFLKGGAKEGECFASIWLIRLNVRLKEFSPQKRGRGGVGGGWEMKLSKNQI